MSSDAFDYHKAQVQRRCKVCARVLNKKAMKNSSFCSDNATFLEKCFKLNIKHDDPLCNSCRTKSKQYSQGREVDSAMEAYKWMPHTEGGCLQCNFFQSQEHGGRQPKMRGRPKIKSCKGIAGEIR